VIGKNSFYLKRNESMVVWNGESAASLLGELGFRCHYRNTKTANFSLTSSQLREISIPVTRQDGVTAYVNAYSATGQVFPIDGIDGIDVEERYPLGHQGSDGNPGIAGSVARNNSSLNPRNNEVLRIHIRDRESLIDLLAWYGR
jgi:hypothetical protein